MSLKNLIEEKLKVNFEPIHLEVIDESSNHNVPPGTESHFKVIVVSKKFEGLTLMEQHQSINQILKEELKNKIHALSIITKTPAKWNSANNIPDSPPCLGGSKEK